MKKLGIHVIGVLFLAGSFARAAGVLGVGTVTPFPAPKHSGVPINFQLWQWGDQPSDRKEILELKNGMNIPYQSLPKTGIHFKFRIAAPHDSVKCLVLSSDGVDRLGWGPEKVALEGSADRLYRSNPEWIYSPPQVGRYCVQVEATNAGKPVASSIIVFRIIDGRATPRNTQYLVGKKDSKGNSITSSRPVELVNLNETPILKDNDYPFEPQHAYNVINWERFPPFSLPSRFVAVWNSRRFTDEDKFGDPLSRGFTNIETIKFEQDNLPINQRAWFHTPDAQVAVINKWFAEDPKKYADLKGYADYRSAFVSAENAYKLGAACYSSWGAGGYAPYDPGIYGWDE
ncbi:MAG: hypothetical protein M3Y56_14120, partial [Armatimonadota bacterium]|nr:hypothetical protein [Armatimonadota bacterium]